MIQLELNQYFALYKAYRYSMYLKEYQPQQEYITCKELSNEPIHVDFIIHSANRFFEEQPKLLKEVEKEYFNLKSRKHRANHRIRYMLDKDIQNCMFFTLTFDDATLNNTSEETRRRYVFRALKECCSDYLANIDYGTKTEREHYHAVGIIKDKSYLIKAKSRRSKPIFNLSKTVYNKGLTTVEDIPNVEDYLKLSNYINKFTNHAFKKTNKLIYSRSFSNEEYKLKSLYYELEESNLSVKMNTYDFNKRLQKRKNIRTKTDNIENGKD